MKWTHINLFKNSNLTAASSFLLKQMRPFSSFKRQTHFFEWTTNTWQKLMVWGCCLNSYNFGRLVIWYDSYLWFPDSLPVKLALIKFSKKILLAQKIQGESRGPFKYLTSSAGREARKNTFFTFLAIGPVYKGSTFCRNLNLVKVKILRLLSSPVF